MPGFNTIPVTGSGGGGQPNMSYVGSVHMVTYNRTWNQGGTAGYYAVYSTNQENGYVYFVGATTTGGPLNRLINVTHSFTSINIIAPQNDMCTLYKAKVKSTTIFNNPFAAFASFPSVIRSSGNFVLPNNALPLVNVLVQGGGGGGGQGTHHHAGGGGGGGGTIKLTAFQAVGTTAITIGGAGSSGGNRTKGGDTYFGNVYALGGGGGGHHGNHGGGIGHNGGANGGGGGAHSTQSGGTGETQTASTGLGTSGSPVYHGGFTGGTSHGNHNHHQRGGGGAGSGGNGNPSHNNSNGDGGPGHVSDISGGNIMYGAGNGGGGHGGRGAEGWSGHNAYGHGGKGRDDDNSDRGGSDIGAVIIRYYIP